MSSTFVLPPYGPARDTAILEAIASGSLDSPTWINIQLDRVVLRVSSDYLTIGGMRVPMGASVAQAAVNYLESILPTKAIVDAIEIAARDHGQMVPFMAWPTWQGDSQLQSSTVLWREQNIAQFVGNAPMGTLFAGHLKDVILSAFMPTGRVVIYGGRDVNGKRVQPVYPIPGGEPGHEATFDGGYAHGVRAVRNTCLLDGKPTTVRDILQDPTLAPLLGGPVAMTSYPTTLSTTVSATGTFTRQMWKGMRGPDVKEVQELLCKAKFSVVVDGIFGRETEMNVSSFQAEYGLAQTGKVDAKTLAFLRGETPPDSSPVGNPIKAALPKIAFNQAKNYYPGRRRPIDRICLHDMESVRTKTTAENVASWFAGADAPMASTHYNIDCDSIVQSVHDEDTAFGAKGMNADAIHIELAGRASQSSVEWSDDYSTAMLGLAAQLVYSLCEKWDVPKKFVDAAGLLRGERGITTHAEVTKAFKQSTHTDPGPNFPIAAFIASVNRIIP